jgi:hypothetical protein
MSSNKKHGRIHVVEKERKNNKHIHSQIQKKIINFSYSRLLLYNLLAYRGGTLTLKTKVKCHPYLHLWVQKIGGRLRIWDLSRVIYI